MLLWQQVGRFFQTIDRMFHIPGKHHWWVHSAIQMGQTHDAILMVALDGFVTTNFCDIVIGSLELGGMLRSASPFSSSFRISPSQPFFLPPSLSLLLHLPRFLSLPHPLHLPQFFPPSTPSSISSYHFSFPPFLSPFLTGERWQWYRQYKQWSWRLSSWETRRKRGGGRGWGRGQGRRKDGKGREEWARHVVAPNTDFLAKILSSSFGSPWDDKVWSGKPKSKHLCQAHVPLTWWLVCTDLSLVTSQL